MTSPSLHGSHRGCKIIAKRQPSNTPRKLLDGRYCITHKVDLCMCGSTWDHGLSEEVREKRTTKPYGEHTLKDVLPTEQETV
jgi:hypothetical protein